MATRSEKAHPRPAPTITRVRSPALTWLLVASLAANAVMGGLLLKRPGVSKKEREAPVVDRPIPAAPTAAKPAEIPLTPELTSYASLGTYVAESNHIPSLKWTEPQFNAFERGVRASYEGRGFTVNSDTLKLRDEISVKVRALFETKPSNPVEDYLATLREKEGVQRTSTGLHYRITQEGRGQPAGPDSIVVASYGARLPDGAPVPGLTRARARSAVGDLLPGLGEGVQMIAPGGKILVYLPPALSFRDGPWPAEVPKGSPIIFFVELHEVSEGEPK